MAKQMEEVTLIITGTDTGPTKAEFVYRVCDNVDTSLSKTVHVDVDTPVFTVDNTFDFFDGYVATFKANEGIA